MGRGWGMHEAVRGGLGASMMFEVGAREARNGAWLSIRFKSACGWGVGFEG